MTTNEMVKELERRGVSELPERNLLTGKSECPRCGRRGRIDSDFGTRVMRGSIWAQSWCRACRAGAIGVKAAAAFWAAREEEKK